LRARPGQARVTPVDIEFFAGIVRTGTVLGAEADLGPDGVERVLGGEYGKNVDGGNYCYNYDIAEFFFYDRPRGLGWQGEHFSVQIHRLRKPVRSAELRAEFPFVEVREEHGYRTYWHADSEMTMLVEVDTDAVYQISSAFRVLHGIRPVTDWKAEMRSLEHVAGLPDDERLAWFEREKPDTGVLDWWLGKCRLITARARTFDRLADRATWGRFALWAWGHESVPPATAAIQVADLLATVDNHLTAEWPATPPADSVVRECLSHVTGSMSRTDKNLVDVAAWHRHGVQDQALLATLDDLITTRRDVPSASLPEW
jgi:hypothetical protein